MTERLNTEFITPKDKPLIISFPVVFTPKEDMNGRLKYTAEILISKDDKVTENAIRTCIQNAATNKFGSKAPKVVKGPLHDGDGAKPNGNAWPDEYKGYWVLRASANADHPPLLRDATRNGMDLRQDPQGATKIYGGCKCYFVLNFWGYDSTTNKGVSCNLSQVMFAEDGVAFGGGHTNPNALDGYFEEASNPFAAFA